MIVSRSSDGLPRVPNASGRSWTIGYIGKNAGAPIPATPDAVFPDAYIIEQKPLSSGGPHFHLQDEFQIVMSGAGTIGKHGVQAFSVHYAGAYTPYGPIDAGSEGIGYLTLRARYDPGAQMMPEQREALRAGKRRPRARFSERLQLGRTEEVFVPEPDGLAAYHYHVPPNGTATGPDPPLGGGQFWVVLDGTMRAPDGRTLPPRSCVFVSADEPVQRPGASPETPLDVLVVQFPAS